MKIRLTYVAFAFVAAIAFVSAEQSDGARTLMEAARKKEVVDGDLKAAIQQYQTIVDKYKSDRAVVADALVRMAECYQKLGTRRQSRSSTGWFESTAISGRRRRLRAPGWTADFARAPRRPNRSDRSGPGLAPIRRSQSRVMDGT
jgi:hypothetical protein